MRNKSLQRFAFFFVFVIPVGWYLFLQLFGENNFHIEPKLKVGTACSGRDGIWIGVKDDSLSLLERNYFQRITYAADKHEVGLIRFDNKFLDCINQSPIDVILVGDNELYGTYKLGREEVNQLVSELDLLIFQKSYGKGVSR